MDLKMNSPRAIIALLVLVTATYSFAASTNKRHHSDYCDPQCQHGSCIYVQDDHNYYRCTCERGWMGANCGSRARCGSAAYCMHGQCHQHSDGYHRCTCESGWTGDSCDQAAVQTVHCSHECKHGNCTFDNIQNTLMCKCEADWTGSQCDTKAAVQTVHCPHECKHGNCTFDNIQNIHMCKCEADWTGSQCDTKALCASHRCTNGDCLRAPSGHHYCECWPGWKGFYCEKATTATVILSTTHKTTPIASTKASTTTKITTTTTTTTTAKPSTSTPATTSTVSPYHMYYQCHKLATVNDIALQTVSINANASMCTFSGSHSSPESFVLNHCDTLPTSSSWRQGKQVMADCSAIPTYTPVATFANGVYSSTGGMVGLFLGCLPTGFIIAVQHCDQNPIIEHIEQGGMFTFNPFAYYMIQ